MNGFCILRFPSYDKKVYEKKKIKRLKKSNENMIPIVQLNIQLLYLGTKTEIVISFLLTFLWLD